MQATPFKSNVTIVLKNKGFWIDSSKDKRGKMGGQENISTSSVAVQGILKIIILSAKKVDRCPTSSSILMHKNILHKNIYMTETNTDILWL